MAQVREFANGQSIMTPINLDHIDDDQQSISSVPSLTTAATEETAVLFAAVDEVVKLFFDDSKFQQSLERVESLTGTARKSFEKETKQVIKEFASNLTEEAQNPVAKVATAFVSSRTRTIARKLNACVFSQDKRLELEGADLEILKIALIEQYLFH